MQPHHDGHGHGHGHARAAVAVAVAVDAHLIIPRLLLVSGSDSSLSPRPRSLNEAFQCPGQAATARFFFLYFINARLRRCSKGSLGNLGLKHGIPFIGSDPVFEDRCRRRYRNPPLVSTHATICNPSRSCQRLSSNFLPPAVVF
ncbi:hypothetical protein ACJQWK_11530 [Exserohilum turcicum]